jgi:hypothetical protein
VLDLTGSAPSTSCADGERPPSSGRRSCRQSGDGGAAFLRCGRERLKSPRSVGTSCSRSDGCGPRA